MRFDILALAVLGLGSLAPAVAADAPPTTQPERAAAPAAAADASAAPATSTATKDPATPSAASPAASPPAATQAAAPELSPAESHLIDLGYKPQMRNGQKIYCRREAPMGSRISSGQHCGTVAELATTTQEGRQGLERTQRNTVSPMPH
ncbi:MAG: hypothetical protein JO158_07310 [Gammaproteobacteria bacterium]|nr:hypothetical protein [Gammaproteobacteria bacterium]MBV9723697.1 hypothetical protein [Gammaproteobacteria bacterium]